MPMDWDAYIESLLEDGPRPQRRFFQPYTPPTPAAPTPEEPGLGSKVLGGLTDALGFAKRRVDIASNYYANDYLRRRVVSGEEPVPSEVLMKEALIAPPDPTMSKSEQHARSIGRGLTEGTTRILTDPLAMSLMGGGRYLAGKFAGNLVKSRVLGARIVPRALERPIPKLGVSPLHAGFMTMMAHGMYEGGKVAYGKYREEGLSPGVSEELAKVGVDAGLISAPFIIRAARGRRPGVAPAAEAPGAAPAAEAPGAPPPGAPRALPPGPERPAIGPGEGAVGRPRDTWFPRPPARGAPIPAYEIPRPGLPPGPGALVPRPPVAPLAASGEGMPRPSRPSKANLSTRPERANLEAHESLLGEVENALRVAVGEGNAHEAIRLIRLRESIRESAWQSQPGTAAGLREPYEKPGLVHEVVQQPENRPRMMEIRAELEKHLAEAGDPVDRAKVRAAIATLDAQLRQNPMPKPPPPPEPTAPGMQPAVPPGGPPPEGAPPGPAAPPPGAPPGAPAAPAGLPGPAPEARISPSGARMAGAGAEPAARAVEGQVEMRQAIPGLVEQAQARVTGLPEGMPPALPAEAGPPGPVAVTGPIRDIAARAAAPEAPAAPTAVPPPMGPLPAAPTAPGPPAGAPPPGAPPPTALRRAGFLEYGEGMPTEPLGEMPYVPEAQRAGEWGRLREQVKAAEEAGAPIKEAAARIAEGYPEDVRVNVERQADMLLQNRDIGREYLETFRMEDGYRKQVAEGPTKTFTDEKTGLDVEFYEARGKNGDYIVRGPDGDIIAGARVMNGTYSMLVGGDRIMDLPPEAIGAVYRVTKAQKVGSSKAVTPAGSAAQARAAARGLDVRGGVPEIVSGGERGIERARAEAPEPAEGPVPKALPEGEPGPGPPRDVREPGGGPGERPAPSRAEARLSREAAERHRTMAVLADAPGGRVTSAALVEAGFPKKTAVQITRTLEREGVLKWSRSREDYALTKKGREVVGEEVGLARPAPPAEPTPEPAPEAPTKLVKFRPKKMTAKALAATAPEGKLITGTLNGETWHGTPDVLVRAKPPRVGAKLIEGGQNEAIEMIVEPAARDARTKAEIGEVVGDDVTVRLADGTEVMVPKDALAHAAKTKGDLTWFGKEGGTHLVAYQGDLAAPGKRPYAVVRTKGGPTEPVPWEDSAPKHWINRETNLAMEGLEQSIRRVNEAGNLKTFAEERTTRQKGYERPDIIDEFLAGRQIDPSTEYVLNRSKMKRLRARLRDKVEGEWQEEMSAAFDDVPLKGPAFEKAADSAEARIRAAREGRPGEVGAVDVDLLLWPGRLARDAVLVGARVAKRGFTEFGTWAAQMGRVLGGGLKNLKALWGWVQSIFGPGRPGEPSVPPRPGQGAPRPEVPAADVPPSQPKPKAEPGIGKKGKVRTPTADETYRATEFEGPLRPGEKPKATDYPINVERLTTDKAMREEQHRLAEALKERLNQNREYRSWTEARKTAVEAGLDETAFKRLVKERGVVTDAEIEAGRILREQSAIDYVQRRKALDALRQSESARPEEIARLEEQMLESASRWGSLTAHTTAAKAEIGRSLSILRRFSESLSPEERLYQQAFKYGMKKGVDPALMDQLADAVLAKDHAKIAELGRRVMQPSLIDKINEFFINNILSAPPTPAANVLGNWGHEMMLRTPERWLAGVIEVGAAKRAGRAPQRLPQEAFEALRANWQAGFGFTKNSTKTMLKDIFKENPWDPELAGIKGEFRPPALGGPLGKVWRTPMRALRALDKAARSSAYEAQVAAEVYRDGFNAGRTRGLTGEGLRQYMETHSASLIKDLSRWREVDVARRLNGEKALTETDKKLYYNERLNRIGRNAERAARTSTFQDLPGTFTRAALRLRNTHPWLTLFVPFIATPSRILSQAMARTPFGLARAVKRAAKGETKGGVAADELAAGVWGTMLSAGLYGLAESGIITGSGPTDPKERSLWKKAGKEPYSVKIGDTWVSMARLEPMATVLGLAADLSEVKNAKKAGDAVDKLVAAATNNIMSKTYLEGVSSLIEAVEDPERYGSMFAKKFVGSVTVPNIVAAAARATDPFVRETSPVESKIPGLGYVLPIVKSRIPGVSRTLPKMRYGTGRR